MMVLALAVWVCVGCALGRVDVVDAVGRDGTPVGCGMPVAGWVPLGVLPVGWSHPATARQAVPNMPARNLRRVGWRPPSMSFLL
jgi:hypothetical protein